MTVLDTKPKCTYLRRQDCVEPLSQYLTLQFQLLLRRISSSFSHFDSELVIVLEENPHTACPGVSHGADNVLHDESLVSGGWAEGLEVSETRQVTERRDTQSDVITAAGDVVHVVRGMRYSRS